MQFIGTAGPEREQALSHPALHGKGLDIAAAAHHLHGGHADILLHLSGKCFSCGHRISGIPAANKSCNSLINQGVGGPNLNCDVDDLVADVG